MVREPASVNVSYRGLPIARGARLVPEGSGGYVEVDQPMPVGTEIVLYLAEAGSEDDRRGMVVKVTKVTEGAGRAGARVELVGRTDVVVAFPEGAVPEAIPVAATMPMSAASGAALAAALAGAGSGPVVVSSTSGSGPVVVPGSGPVMVAAPPPPVVAPPEVEIPMPVPQRAVEPAPPDAPVRKSSVLMAPVSVIGGAKPSADGGDDAKVDLKNLEVEGDDGPGGGKKGGKRKRRNTMIGR